MKILEIENIENLKPKMRFILSTEGVENFNFEYELMLVFPKSYILEKFKIIKICKSGIYFRPVNKRKKEVFLQYNMFSAKDFYLLK